MEHLIDRYDRFGTLSTWTEADVALTSRATARSFVETVCSMCAAFGISPSVFNVPSLHELVTLEELQAMNCACPHLRSVVDSTCAAKSAREQLQLYAGSALGQCTGACAVCCETGDVDAAEAATNGDVCGSPQSLHGHCVGCRRCEDNPRALCPAHARRHCESSVAAARLMMALLDEEDGCGDRSSGEPAIVDVAHGNEEDRVTDRAADALLQHSIVAFALGEACVTYCFQCSAFAPMTTFELVRNDSNDTDVDAAGAVSALEVGQLMNKLLLAAHCARAMQEPTAEEVQRYHRKGLFLYRPTLYADEHPESGALNEALEADIVETATDVVLPCGGDAALLREPCAPAVEDSALFHSLRLALRIESPAAAIAPLRVDPAAGIDDERETRIAGVSGFLLVFKSHDDVLAKGAALASHGNVQLVERRVYLRNEKLWCTALVACHQVICNAEDWGALLASPAAVTHVDDCNRGDSDDEVEALVAAELAHLPLDESTFAGDAAAGDALASANPRQRFEAELAAAAGCPCSDASRMMRFLGGMTTVAQFMATAPQLARNEGISED